MEIVLGAVPRASITIYSLEMTSILEVSPIFLVVSFSGLVTLHRFLNGSIPICVFLSFLVHKRPRIIFFLLVHYLD